MLKSLSLLALLGALSTAQSATFILAEANFDGTNDLNTGNTGVSTTIIADPTGGGMGNVASADISGGNQWGEVRTTPAQSIPLPAQTTAGVDTLTATFDVYIPSGTTFSSAGGGVDRINLIIRQSNGPDNANRVSPGASNNNWNTIPADTWTPITVNVGISAVDNAAQPITHLTPIISFFDPPTGSGAGVAAYIDNFSLSVTGIPEPTAGVLGLFGMLLILRRRR